DIERDRAVEQERDIERDMSRDEVGTDGVTIERDSHRESNRSESNRFEELQTPARARVDELSAILKRKWGTWGTKVLTPDGASCESAAQLLVTYADAAGEVDLAALAERAVRVAFVGKLLPSWSFTGFATPAMFVRKWDDVQAVLGGAEPGKRAS